MSHQEKLLSLALVVLSLLLLYPGISQPVMTVVGTLDRAGMVEIGQEAVIDARVNKALANNPDGDVERLRRRKGRTVRFLSGMFSLDEVSGQVEVYHKSSSVLDTVQTLWGKGHPLVAGLVALFSMIIPILKNIMLLVAVFAAQSPLGRWMSKASAWIGKWSMADVYLVALFVGFLAFNATSAMDGVLELNATVESGLYWFAAYCVVSILAGQIISAQIAKKPLPKKKKSRR